MSIQFSASERGIANLNVTWKNIVTDYGATDGGSGTNNGDYTAFKAFHDWAIEQTGWVGLTIPPSPSGQYYGTQGSYTHGSNMPFFGIPKLIVFGYGAEMNGLHGRGLFPQSNVRRALIDTVASGANQVTLKAADAAKIQYYVPGGMMIVAGLDMQAGWGYPPNPHFFEWVRIASVNGTTITLEQPLQNEYRYDWPRYFEGNNLEIGGFGAAAICPAAPGWDCEHRLYGLRSRNPGQQTYYFVRKSYLFDVKSNDNGFIVGASEDMRIGDQDHTLTHHEVDKLTTRAIIRNYGPSNKNIDIQSSSVGYMEVHGGSRVINGTARLMLIRGGTRSTINIGPLAYGASEYIEIRDAEVTSQINGGVAMSKNLGDNLTYEGDGVFRCVDPGAGVNYWFVPGAVGVIVTATPSHRHSPFRILSVTSETGEIDSPVLLQTTLNGSTLPEVSGVANGSIVNVVAPNLTVINCTGCADADELSLVPPNSPYGIFKRRTFTLNGSTTFGFLMGRLVHMKVNVQQAYTGVASSLTLRLGGQFGSYILDGDMASVRNEFPPSQINLKIAGERVITPGGVTGTQSGDTGLSFYTGGVWMSTAFGVFIGNGNSAVDISGESASVRPIVTVEILTDQEIPAAA